MVWPVLGTFDLCINTVGIIIQGVRVLTNGAQKFLKWPIRPRIKGGKTMRRNTGGILEDSIVLDCDSDESTRLHRAIGKALREQGFIS